MSTIAASNTINNPLIKIDQICDYIPVISTFTNLIAIFEKCAFKGCSSESIKSNHYFSHINDKSLLRCVTLLVPILGNIIVGIYHLIQKHREEVNEREAQDILKQDQITKNNQQENLQNIINSLDVQIAAIRVSIEKFGKIIANPEEPVIDVFQTIFGPVKISREGTHREKIDHYWFSVKLIFLLEECVNPIVGISGLDPDKSIIQKQQELSGLRKKLLELRQAWYHGYVQTIEKNELLHEAKKYYLESLLGEEYKGFDATIICAMTLDAILPKLKERVLAKAEKDYDSIEMREIISQIERTKALEL